MKLPDPQNLSASEITAGIGLLAGVLAVAKKWASKVGKSGGAMRAAISLHRAFGEDAGDKLQALIKEINHAQTVADVTRNLIHKHLDVGVYVCDPAGACVWVSPHLASMFAMAEQEMLGFGWVAPITDKFRAHTAWKQSVDNRIPYSDRYIVHPQNGAPAFKAMTEAMPVTAADGTALCYVGYVKRESFLRETKETP